MKKMILAITVAAFSTMGVYAQNSKPTTLSIGANIGLPTSSGPSFAYGIDLQADFGVAETTKITASAGYEGYSYKGGFSSGIIPLLAGAKFGFAEKMYGHAQLGYAFYSKGGSGAFAYAPSIGYYVSPNLDLALKYLATSRSGATAGSINLRVAYNF